jgi:molybdopterin synthase sulfur carrier subunit
MKLAVKLFARAKDLAGSGLVTIELPEPATVGSVRAALTSTYPALAPIASSLLIAVGTDYANDQQPVTAVSDIACFPPVSGG